MYLDVLRSLQHCSADEELIAEVVIAAQTLYLDHFDGVLWIFF